VTHDPPTAWHALSSREALARLESDGSAGLATAEVAARRARFGLNALPESGGRSLLSRVADQFRDTLIWVLLAATAVSAALGEFLDAGVIVAIILLNALLGVIQERKAERALAALAHLAAPTARVLRDGVTTDIPARELVPGDLLLVEAGDRVPADARLLEAVNLRLEEASLTGESVPSAKDAGAVLSPDAAVGDRVNLLYMGTSVSQGRGRALVVATGAKTELGRIATLVSGLEEEKTPLQERLESLGKGLALMVLAVCVIVFAAGALRGAPLGDLFLTAVSLAVAAIPEGLPAVVTIVLALGTQRMVHRNAIVRRLRAVEALGSTTVICTDKTGTLTVNAMTVRRFLVGETTGTVTGEGYGPEGEFEPNPEDLRLLLEIAALCNDARLVERDGVWQVQGDPTEGALLTAAAKAGIERAGLEQEWPRRAEVPFDSSRKRMSTIHEARGGFFRVCVKGAPDVLLRHCGRRLRAGDVEPLDDAAREAILAVNAAFADEALRVLGFAYRELDGLPDTIEEADVERDLVFVGLLGMIDPPRPEARAAVARCRAAGIRPVMVTGDYAETARAVARDLELAPPGAQILTGAQVEGFSDAALAEALPQVAIFARVSPADKLRIVEGYQAAGEIVAMTGDGVNDAPALKRADIGVAMGRTGTDVAREAADLVLTDDNFASIVAAVEEGRGIFAGVRKFIYYLLSCNLSEVLTIFLAILVGLPLPLVPVQLLWVNLVSDGLPALALGVDPQEPGLMDRPPRDPESGVLDALALRNIAWYGGCLTAVTLLAFLYGLSRAGRFAADPLSFPQTIAALATPANWHGVDLREARTMAFCTLALAQLAHAFNCRSDTLSLFTRVDGRPFGLTNPRLIGAVALSATAQLAVVYLPPLQHAFDTVPLNSNDLAVLVTLALTPILFGESLKFVRGLRHRRAPRVARS
jgi:Ca2+-transporting ATPase